MQSLDYKLKTSNISYMTARRAVLPSSLSSFSPITSDQRRPSSTPSLKERLPR